jgi:hypothetical protein
MDDIEEILNEFDFFFRYDKRRQRNRLESKKPSQ